MNTQIISVGNGLPTKIVRNWRVLKIVLNKNKLPVKLKIYFSEVETLYFTVVKIIENIPNNIVVKSESTELKITPQDFQQ